MAQKTDAARKRGGSPTALLEYTALGFEAPLMRKKLKNYHLHHCCHNCEIRSRVGQSVESALIALAAIFFGS